MEDHHKIEEGFWIYRPKQRHVNRYRLALPFYRLGLDVYLEGIQLVYQDIANVRVGLLGDWRRRPTIIPVFFWEL